MSEEEFDDEETESAEEWQAEAGKWKQKASEAERAAAENAGAAARLAELERSGQQASDEYAKALDAAKAEAAESTRSAKADGEKTAADWQAEAEKWKQLSQKNEQLAKQNLAAAKRLEKLEAESVTAGKKAADTKAEIEAKAAETKADLEAKLTDAQAKALRIEVAQELGVPKGLVGLLRGSTKKEIEEFAQNLLIQVERNKQPEPEPVKPEDEPEAKEKAELAQAKKALQDAEVRALRLEVAADKQLPTALADLLSANTREELIGQADALLAAIGGVKSAETSTRARMPVQRLRPGALPEGANEPDADPQAVAEAIMRRSRGY